MDLKLQHFRKKYLHHILQKLQMIKTKKIYKNKITLQRVLREQNHSQADPKELHFEALFQGKKNPFFV